MAEIGTVDASSLNLRDSPNGQIIGKLARGAAVEILGADKGWLKVRSGNQVGFVKADFIKKGQPDADPPLFKFVGKKAVAPDGTVFANKFKLGVFNVGETSIADFVSRHPERFAVVAPSRLRVMQAVSANEGKLEAINTWDNAFLTFGAFQWTVGTGSGAGELPGLLNRLKQNDSAAFDRFFGQHGLGVSLATVGANAPPAGFFLLEGVQLKSVLQKERLRTLEWAFRFWFSGKDDVVRQAEVEHAMMRVDLFYRSPAHQIRDRFIAGYVSSEYGVALLLDEHVNRPGHVPGTLAKAVDLFMAQTGLDEPESWTSADERRLLEIYLRFREQTTMTDSKKRADTVRQAVVAGLASEVRGSYTA